MPSDSQISFQFHVPLTRLWDHSLNTPCVSLLGNPLLPNPKALPLIFTACSHPPLTFPGRISNFSSVGAYLESSLTVCTGSLRNLHTLDPVLPLLKSVLWKESKMLPLAHVHCGFIYNSKKLETTEHPTTEQLSTLGYRYVIDYYFGF